MPMWASERFDPPQLTPAHPHAVMCFTGNTQVWRVWESRAEQQKLQCSGRIIFGAWTVLHPDGDNITALQVAKLCKAWTATRFPIIWPKKNEELIISKFATCYFDELLHSRSASHLDCNSWLLPMQIFVPWFTPVDRDWSSLLTEDTTILVEQPFLIFE